MPLYGYARVSTLDQDLSVQRAALKAAGCEVIRAEKASGTRRDGRTELQVLLDFLRAGDTLVVTRIDRLARSLKGSVALTRVGWSYVPVAGDHAGGRPNSLLTKLTSPATPASRSRQ
jgi:Resolvase, N terminal domain